MNNTQELQAELQRSQLKVQALVEKISELTSNYENQCADYRVDITLLSNYVERLENEAKDNDSGEKEDPEA